jgi:hypothetical protein
MDSRSRFYELSWDAVEWLAANRWRGRVITFGTILLVPFVVAALSGSSMVLALKLAGLQAAVLTAASLLVLGLRHVRF